MAAVSGDFGSFLVLQQQRFWWRIPAAFGIGGPALLSAAVLLVSVDVSTGQ
jgi:hypothetical protein